MAKTIEMKCNLPQLLLIASKEIGNPGLSLGFAMAQSRLNKIAEQALEMGDEIILEQLELIGILETADEEKNEINP